MHKTEQQPITVSIGIPAYNEEQNIGHLVKALLKQGQQGWTLSEVIVGSDGSTDSTVSCVKNIHDSRVQVLDLTIRRGICKVQNELVSRLSGDIVVLLDADILPVTTQYITNLIEPIASELRNGVPEGSTPIGLVAGSYDCATPRTFLERVLVNAFYIKRDAATQWQNGDTIYLCQGSARAFAKDFVTNLRWQDTYGEDVYSYLACKQAGFAFAYAENAKALFRVPSVYADYVRQSLRYRTSKDQMKAFFPERIVEEAYTIPTKLLGAAVLRYLITHPVLTTAYIGLMAFTYNTRSPRNDNGFTPHEAVPSTKELAQGFTIEEAAELPHKTVTVGIPACNEERNIGKLLTTILSQQEATITIESIIVVSDGSTDRTADIVRACDDPRVSLIELSKQQGVAHAQNSIAEKAQSDVLVLFDADIIPKDKYVIEGLVRPFQEDGKVMLTSCRANPTTPQTKFENIIAAAEHLKNDAFAKTRNGNNLYCCRGRACALAKEFYTTIHWPDKHADDTYSYLWCKESNETFAYVNDVIVYFRPPQNYSDHKQQSLRYLRGKFNNSDFTHVDVAGEYALDKRVFLHVGIRHFMKHPLALSAYAGTLALVRLERLFARKERDSSKWSPVPSSKNV